MKSRVIEWEGMVLREGGDWTGVDVKKRERRGVEIQV